MATDKSVIQRIADELLEGGIAELKRERQQEEKFLARHRARWSESFFITEVFLHSTAGLGQLVNAAERPAAAQRQDAKFEALIRNHARAVRVGREVYVLAASGHPDGAMARWRTMHEIAVICLLLSARPTTLSERYLLHDTVESHRSAKAHLAHANRLDCVVPTPEEMAELERLVQELKAEFGTAFLKDNGWARPAFPELSPKARISFAQIEALVGLDHWRPRYLMASQVAHAPSKSSFWSLGAGRMDGFLLSGASSDGLADALHPLFIGLNQISNCLVENWPTAERLQMLGALIELSDRAGELLVNEDAKPAP